MARQGQRKGRSMVIVVGVLALLAGGAVAAYQALKPDPGQAARAATADLARAERQSFDITTTATGELEARRSVELRSQLEQGSSIVDVVAEGSFVRAGTLLVRLKSDDIRNQIEEETLRTESARADRIAAENQYEIQVSQNQTRLEQAQVKQRLAELTLQQWLEGDDKQRAQDLSLDLERADKDLTRTQELYTRKQGLFEQGFLSEDELKQEELRLIAANAALRRAQLAQQSYQNYERERSLTQLQSDVDQTAAEVERVQRQNEIELASRDANRINARRQLQVREARLANLQTQLANCDIIAPTDGLVVYSTSLDRGSRWGQQGQTPLQIGRQVSPNESLIVLPDTSEMLAKVRVHESLAGRVRQNQPVRVTIDALPGFTFPGKVMSIGVLAEGSDWRDPNRREYTVRTTIDVPEGVELKPSMRADAEITLGRVENALAVPIQAIFSEGLVRFVYVPRGSKFARVPVQVGRRSELFAEVLAGVEEGTSVLIREPGPAEVLSDPWRPEQLKAVGLELDEAGNPVPIGGMPAQGGPAMRVPGGGPNSGQGPAQNAAQGSGPRPNQDAGGAGGADPSQGGGRNPAGAGDSGNPQRGPRRAPGEQRPTPDSAPDSAPASGSGNDAGNGAGSSAGGSAGNGADSTTPAPAAPSAVAPRPAAPGR